MSYFPAEICVKDCPDPNEINFRRQPGPVTITVEGNRADLNDWFPKLYGWLNNQAVNVDFSVDKGGLTFKVYPFAVND